MSAPPLTSAVLRELLKSNAHRKDEPIHAMFESMATALERAEKAEARVETLEDAHDELYSQFAVMETRALRAEARVKELEAQLAEVLALADEMEGKAGLVETLAAHMPTDVSPAPTIGIVRAFAAELRERAKERPCK